MHCSLWENFTGVTPAVVFDVFDNNVEVIVIKDAAVVIVNGAAVAVVNVVNAHAVAAVKYFSCIYNFAAVVIKAAFVIAHSSVIVVIGVAAFATGNDAAVANVALVIVICLVVFNIAAGAAGNIAADTESNDATVTVISIAKVQVVNVASVAVVNAAAVALMYFAAVAHEIYCNISLQ